ncbi:transcription initiation factor TFIID subunit 11-like [Papaver somniferum]|uniref:transcription initiation factor TFIID subunit 11-like n=1 Tax=Papaver somniferum TaxID=3469 RepID=UPI000E7054FE|nr:transcription initiation factor TFIID subunit 11-like [Papaver somniferum]
MADFPGQNPSNSDDNHPVFPPETPEYSQAKSLLHSLSVIELHKLRDEAQSEIDRRVQEQLRQREEEEVAQWKSRKDEEKAERHAKAPRYGSATGSDFEASDGFEYVVEEVNTSDLESDAAKDKRKMDAYHDGRLKSRFEYELSNPKIFVRTMSEGEPSKVRVRRRISMVDDKETESDEDGEDDDSDEGSSSSGTSPASSDSDDGERYEDEGWDTDKDDWW